MNVKSKDKISGFLFFAHIGVPATRRCCVCRADTAGGVPTTVTAELPIFSPIISPIIFPLFQSSHLFPLASFRTMQSFLYEAELIFR